MLDFGELLTLAICGIAIAYLVMNWQRISRHPVLSSFRGPFLVTFVGWVATVVEDFLREHRGGFTLVFTHTQEAQTLGPAPVPTQVFHCIAHLAYAVAAIWLLVLILRAFRKTRGATT
jgi:hypothetical protein